MSRTKFTELDRPRRTQRKGPLLRARRRETPGARRLSQWGLRELGQRFHASTDPGARGTKLGRVLIVDDETAIRLICRLNLRSAGFETLEAANGVSALDLARAERPDLILLDIMMPELDGWSVAEKLAASEETREIPIVFLSARSDSGDQVRGHGTGGVGYITKPFDPLAMTHTVSEALERVRRGEREAMRREWQRLIDGQ